MTSEFLPRYFSTRCTAREYWNPQCLILPDKDGWTSYRWEYQTWVGFKHPSFLTSALKDPTAPLFSFSLFFVLQTHSYFHRSPNACWFDLFYFIMDTAGNEHFFTPVVPDKKHRVGPSWLASWMLKPTWGILPGVPAGCWKGGRWVGPPGRACVWRMKGLWFSIFWCLKMSVFFPFKIFTLYSAS